MYRKIPNISPGRIEVCKHSLGGLYSGGLIFGGRAYIRGHFVLVSEYQDFKIHCYISLLQAKKRVYMSIVIGLKILGRF